MKTSTILQLIETLFDELSAILKVDILVTLYFKLSDKRKDQFLRRTDNA